MSAWLDPRLQHQLKHRYRVLAIVVVYEATQIEAVLAECRLAPEQVFPRLKAVVVQIDQAQLKQLVQHPSVFCLSATTIDAF